MADKHATRFLKLVNESKARIQECTIADVHQMMSNGDPFTLIDVREESEFAKGHVPGAIHLGKGIIERDIEKTVPEPTEKVVLYCGGGYRSALAADALNQMGYENVISMDGGWRGWKESGYEIEVPGETS